MSTAPALSEETIEAVALYANPLFEAINRCSSSSERVEHKRAVIWSLFTSLGPEQRSALLRFLDYANRRLSN